MPIARCAKCGPPNRKFSANCLSVEPHGYPASGLICGVAGCQDPALMWLTAWEVAEFKEGRRIFNVSGRSPKVLVGERTHPVQPRPLEDCAPRLAAGHRPACTRFGSVLRGVRDLMDMAGSATLTLGRVG